MMDLDLRRLRKRRVSQVISLHTHVNSVSDLTIGD